VSEALTILRAEALNGVAHGFIGRTGGVTTGPTASLDMSRRGLPPTPELQENQRRVIAAIAPDSRFATVHQVHSPDAVIVADGWDEDARPHADALVTDRPGILLGILTADCAPVLFADREAGVVAAAHAGWKGALQGVTDTTIARMEELGADRSRIAAAVGPCTDPANERFFTPGKPGHHQFDLEAYVVHRLALAGLRRIEALGADTYADPARFFSYRRATHEGAPDYGRQISVIALTE